MGASVDDDVGRSTAVAVSVESAATLVEEVVYSAGAAGG